LRTLVSAAAAVALLLGAPVALAHEGNPNYRSVVSKVTPADPGIDVSVLNFDDRLLLHNTSGKDVLILDYADPPKPYARVLADGTVEVNTNSEAYYLNQDRQGEGDVPQNLADEPQWRQVSRSARFEWHDHRAHWMGEGDPPGLTDKDQRTKIFDWTVPIQVDGQDGSIAGTLTWVPTESGPIPLGAIFGFAALVVVLALVVFFVRRRRAAAAERDGGEDAERREEVVEAW
jgi:hypothetical protein